MNKTSTGPLNGLRVVELAGIGPVPFAGMHLAQMGADVHVVNRPTLMGSPVPPTSDPYRQGKSFVEIDLKSSVGRESFLDLVAQADVVLEGYRPGVLERLELGPTVLLRCNPELVLGRMTGWGQNGPWAHRAGHDVNYIGLTGALGAIGPREGPPALPLNLLGDYGGGALYLVVGVLAALREIGRGGEGQVVDAAIVDGVAHMLTGVYAGLDSGLWVNDRQSNIVDGGAPYYRVYTTRDGRYIAVSAGEEAFYRELVAGLGVTVDLDLRHDRRSWDKTAAVFAEAFGKRTRAEWMTIFDGADACVSPVLDLREAMEHPQIRARATLSRQNGSIHAAAAPRFLRRSDLTAGR